MAKKHLEDECELSIAVPFYNEEGNVAEVAEGLARELEKNKIDYEIVLINNGSTDSTPKIINKLRGKNPKLKQLDIIKNIGYGNGIVNGLNAAKGKYIGFLDGDNQVHPKFVVEAYNKLKNSNAALCMTKRSIRNDGLMRKIASLGYNSILNILFLTNVRDVNSKPKILNNKFYKELNLYSKDWFIDTEIVLKSKSGKIQDC